jgi:heterodisulfide reductase subunit C2
MTMHSHSHTFADTVAEITGQDPALCYQCGKCSAGCPVRAYTDEAPNRVVRFVQLGCEDKALHARTLWLCAGCQTCSTRCPQEFDLAGFMDAMRELALKRGIKPLEADTKAFHDAFLAQIEHHGRSFEFGLVRDYKLKTMNLMQDVENAPVMFLKGKIGLFPHHVENPSAMRRIFKRAEEI